MKVQKVERQLMDGFGGIIQKKEYMNCNLSLCEGKVDLSGPKFRCIVSGAKLLETWTGYNGSDYQISLKVLSPAGHGRHWREERWYITF